MLAERLRRLFGWIALACISVLFIGFLPGKISKNFRGKGGGLMGALAGLGFQLCFFHPSNKWLMGIAVAASYLLGWMAVSLGENYFFLRYGSQKRHTGEIVARDYNQTCLDEFHGQLLSGLPIWFLDSVSQEWRIAGLFLLFALFRLYDTKKPWIIGKFERANEGTAFGIMFDDTLAAMFAIGTVGAFVCIVWFLQ